jgi:solute carrier family 25 carnitine/acylcarnitine transporter 20/29
MTKTSHCIAGSVTAGCFSTILGHPLDTVKVHQQTKPQFSNASSLQVARILAKDGVLQLFRGIGPPMANQILMNTVMFSVFNQVKTHANGSPYLNETTAALFAGLFSGFATACLSTPGDWIKIQAQISLTEGAGKRTDVVSMLKREFGKTGSFQFDTMTRTLYRGHVANLGREGVFTMVYLGLYDRIYHVVKEDANHEKSDASNNHDMASVALISSFTGACAWICNYPFDTIKSIQQARSSGDKTMTMTSAAQSIYKSGGFRAFFRGAAPSTLRAMMVTSSRMLAYEKTLQLLSTNR